MFGWDKGSMRAVLLFVVVPWLLVIGVAVYVVVDDAFTDDSLSPAQQETIENAVPDNLDQLINDIVNDSLRDLPTPAGTSR